MKNPNTKKGAQLDLGCLDSITFGALVCFGLMNPTPPPPTLLKKKKRQEKPGGGLGGKTPTILELRTIIQHTHGFPPRGFLVERRNGALFCGNPVRIMTGGAIVVISYIAVLGSGVN